MTDPGRVQEPLGGDVAEIARGHERVALGGREHAEELTILERFDRCEEVLHEAGGPERHAMGGSGREQLLDLACK